MRFLDGKSASIYQCSMTLDREIHRSRTAARLLLPALLAIPLFFSGALAVDIAIEGKTEFQTIDGFGGSIMMWIPESKDADWARYCARELGVSIVRCDLHPEIIGTFENRRTFVDDVNINMGFMNSSVREIDIAFTAARNFFDHRLDEMKIMVSVWTQPHWMKTGAEDCRPDPWNRYSMGGYIPHTDDGREQNARYLTAAIKKIESDYGITLHGISPQNELDWWHACETYTQSSKKYYSGDPEGPGYNTWIAETKRLRQELDAKGLTHVKIIGPEHGTFGPGEWNAWQQMKYVRDIYKDPEMLDILDIWAVHSYGVPNSPDPSGRANWSRIWDGHKGGNPELVWNGYKDFGKPNWQTECEAGDDTWDGGAMALANRMQDALIAGHASAFLPWAMGAPNPGVYEVTATSSPYALPKTFAFKHFSRYIRPGSVRLQALPDDLAGVTVSAYRHQAHGSLTIVLVNNGSAETAKIVLPAFAAGMAFFDVFASTRGSFWKTSRISAENGAVRVDVPSKGLVTLYGQVPVSLNRNLPFGARIQKPYAATRYASLFLPNTPYPKSIRADTRVYTIYGKYLGVFGEVWAGKTAIVSHGVHILRRPQSEAE